MKILHISDIHGETGIITSVAKAEDYDLIIATGDFESLSIVKELAQLDKPVFAVSGNMDSKIIRSELETLGLSIEGRVSEFRSYLFAGIGGKYIYDNVTQVISALLSIRNPAPLIIVSHYPPAGVKVDMTYSQIHIGKGILRELIDEFKPALFLCGHVHEARGYDVLKGTLIVNSGPLSTGYYAVIKVDTLKVELKNMAANS